MVHLYLTICLNMNTDIPNRFPVFLVIIYRWRPKQLEGAEKLLSVVQAQ
jgi:hypothetical protein